MAGKSTTQSSIYSGQYSNGTSDKAVDGNPDQKFKNGHCSRTLKDHPSWWRVDLSSPVQVFEVRIVIGHSPSSDGSNVTRNQVYNITLGERNTSRNLLLKHSEQSHKRKDGAYYCYCAYVLRISRYSDFLSVMLTNAGIFLRGLKLCRESRSS